MITAGKFLPLGADIQIKIDNHLNTVCQMRSASEKNKTEKDIESVGCRMGARWYHRVNGAARKASLRR